MRIIFIRHAETDYTQEKIIGEFPGPPLNKKGVLQARALVKSISECPKIVFSSDLKRAVQTVQECGFPCDVHVDKRIREVDDIITGYAKKNRLQESEESQRKRLNSFLEDIKKLDKEIWIFAHFNVIEYLSEQLGKKITKPDHAKIYKLHT